MRGFLIASALAGLAAAAPRPQDINFDAVDGAPEVPVGPAPTQVNQPVTYDAPAAKASASAAVLADLEAGGSKVKREADIVELQSLAKRTACAKQPDGYGPKPADDTVDAFSGFQTFTDTANNAPTPQGYQRSFANLKASVNANSYMGLTTFKTYDTIKCQQLCDAADLCTAFNIYFERDPTVDPGAGCENPASFTNIKCTLWGSGVTTEAAVNNGQWRDQFHVVIAGSNGYTKNNPPDAQPGFDGPTEFGGAINAPLNAQGKNTYMGVKYFPGVYDAGKCAAACTANTAYDHRHPRSDGTYDACNFFNAYLISINNVPDGTYCSLYTQPWGKQYSTNYGQYRGSNYYSVSSSYGYTLSPQDSGHI